MAEVEKKLKWLHAVVVDQWKSGKSAELQLKCGNGHLKVSLCADFDLGPAVSSRSAGTAGAPGDASGRGSPSRLRRKLRRAAERAAAEKAEQTAAEKVVAEMAAAEKAATERKVAEMAAAVKAVAVKEAAEMMKAAETAATEKTVAEKAAVEKETAEKAVTTESASTSSCGSERQMPSEEKSSCLNCDAKLTPDHQCNVLENESKVEVQHVPLPLCHYCCHRGTDEHPVHFFTVCICSDDKCTCHCY